MQIHIDSWYLVNISFDFRCKFPPESGDNTFPVVAPSNYSYLKETAIMHFFKNSKLIFLFVIYGFEFQILQTKP